MQSLKFIIMSVIITDRASLKKAIELGEVSKEYYSPSDSMEWYDGQYFYNACGNTLRDVSEYDPHSEGYTPFGDE